MNVRRYIAEGNGRVTVFFLVAALVVGGFLYFSDGLVSDLAEQERQRMQIWADATRQVVNLGNDNRAEGDEVDFLLSIIEGNNNIPVLLTDAEGNILTWRNFDLPDAENAGSEANAVFLEKKLKGMVAGGNVINIEIEPGNVQHLYYEDSRLLKNLSRYPYIQLALMGAFVLVVYLAVSSSKRAEQNRVWVGLSKETAHQLGTPISSLMAWVEYLKSEGAEREVVDEMDKDVKRLETIASRFSKIGSEPTMMCEDLNVRLKGSVDYMRTRISRRVEFSDDFCGEELPVRMSAPLLEWVFENLIKNAVDAMEGAGRLKVSSFYTPQGAVVEVCDSGKGIARKNFKAVFRAGFTTKKRGWGLGLTLAQRIVEEYHHGRIFIKWSELGKGTILRIELPLV